MRVFALAGLMLATMIGANSASAGFVIDNFSGFVGGRSTVSSTANTGTWKQNGPSSFGALLSYNFGMSGLSVPSSDKIVLKGVTLGGGPVTFSAVLNGFAGNVVASGPNDVAFSFAGLGNFSSINTLTVGIQGASLTPFTFSAESIQAVPEPTTWALIGLAATSGGMVSWRRRRRASAN